MIIGILIGFLAHMLTYNPIQRTSLPMLYSYVCGIVIAKPVFLKLYKEYGDSGKAYDHAFASVGIGVVIGRTIRDWMNQIE